MSASAPPAVRQGQVVRPGVGRAPTSLLDGAFLAAAARRLRWLLGGLMGVLAVLLLLDLAADPRPEATTALAGPSCAGLLFAVSLLYLFSAGALAPAPWLRLGLAYQLLGAAALGLWEYTGAPPDGPTWLAIWILLFPLLLPARPLVHVLVAGAEVALAAGLVAWAGEATELAQALRALAAPTLCGLLAVLPGTLVFRWGRAFREIRERVQDLGSYTLHTRIGRGAMGEVWEARHRMLARPAAVKLIRPEALDTLAAGRERRRLLARFEREARVTAALTSPHTITLYDYGVTPDGSFYYVMEKLRGVELETLVRSSGPLPVARAVHFLRQACASLREAHDVGLIHRDIKPANLFACRIGGRYDFLKVLDFGLVAEPRHGDHSDKSRLTARGAIVGTPAYMAPEQARGQRELSAASDVYALGCVGFWLLTGQLVFPGDSPMRVMVEHLTGEPRPPSAVAAQPLPPALDAAILACLAKEPAERPTVRALDARLAQLAADFPWHERDARGCWQSELPAGAG